ncbi:XRE family transcriptional regulator [Streptomyces sp. RB6PN25]|uniref:XRE family transcriptional regulator n=1 Tax=Streptomyces humicola TaxID=2953240 RepID=A0ABT1PS15_9ACTN|nr:XRE family transcriptional regulator [Streptomyces humicola]MCQ4080466.1 XRE family transcriptional regulator [Streptomyces humicola]
MSHAHVSHGIWASYGLQIPPETVLAWERGAALPDERELTALAAALWCSASDLLGEPTTLREFRWARSMAVVDLARAVGMQPGEYERMEKRNRWTGNDRQTAALRYALGLTVPQLIHLTGREEKLAGYLCSAAETRWQAYVRPVCALVPLPREQLEEALARLHSEYQAMMVSSLSWSASAPKEDKSAPYRAAILDHFWAFLPAAHETP